MVNEITGSKKNRLGEVTVYFGNGQSKRAYDAHSIREIGTPDDDPGQLNTMWAWINHMRAKRWWHAQLEYLFIKEVKKHLHG